MKVFLRRAILSDCLTGGLFIWPQSDAGEQWDILIVKQIFHAQLGEVVFLFFLGWKRKSMWLPLAVRQQWVAVIKNTQTNWK